VLTGLEIAYIVLVLLYVELALMVFTLHQGKHLIVHHARTPLQLVQDIVKHKDFSQMEHNVNLVRPVQIPIVQHLVYKTVFILQEMLQLVDVLPLKA